MKPTFDRPLPHAEAAEQAVLGALLLNPADAGALVFDRLQETDFYLAKHQVVFRHMVAIYDAFKTIDPVTLAQRMADAGALAEVGGPAYLADLSSSIPTLANLEDYITLVADKSLLRRAIALGWSMAEGAFNNDGDVAGYLDTISQQVFDLVTHSRATGGLVKASAHVPAAKAQIGHELDCTGVTGLTTGLDDLDALTGGLKPRTSYVVAARPSVGKTALGMNIAEHVCCDLGLAVGVFSLEMGSIELLKRLLCARARFNVRHVRGLQDPGPALNRLTDAVAAVSGAPLFIDDTPRLSVHQIRARARRLHARQPLGLLVVDYLQLVRAADNPREFKDNRQAQLTEISAGLNALKVELGIPVVVMAQLNRNSEFRETGLPRLADLRESGAIEQDADVVILLHRERIEDSAVLGSDATLIVGKHRNGPTGEVKSYFDGPHTRFCNAARENRA